MQIIISKEMLEDEQAYQMYMQQIATRVKEALLNGEEVTLHPDVYGYIEWRKKLLELNSEEIKIVVK